MSTATPSKHDRIERHIQRQRGAGVRSLATSFGFSFGPSTAAPTTSLGTSHPDEPLAKRRRTSDKGTLPAHQSRIPGQHGVREQLPRPAQSAEPQQQLEDGQEGGKQQGCGTSSRFEENISVKAIKTRARPRKAVTVPAASQDKAKPTAKKRGRPKKVQVPVPHTHPDRVDREDAGLDMAIVAARVAMDSSAVDNAAVRELQDLAPVVKRRGRPNKKMTGEAQNSMSCQTTQETSLQPPRPRRHAATTAMTKVSEGFVEEESDITKKRRDVAAPIRSAPAISPKVIEREAATLFKASAARVRKTVSNDTSIRTYEPTSIQATAARSAELGSAVGPVERAAQVPLYAADSVRVTAMEGEALARPRRRAAIAANIKVTDGFVEEASDISKKRRDSVDGRANASSAGTNLEGITHDLSARPRNTDGGKHTAVLKTRKREQAQAKEATVTRLPLTEAEANIRSTLTKNAALDGSKSPPTWPVPQPCTIATAGVVSTRPKISKPTLSGAKKRKTASVFVDSEAAKGDAAAKSGRDAVNIAAESMPIKDASESVVNKTAPRASWSTLGAQAIEQVPPSTRSRPRKQKSTTQDPTDNEVSPQEDVDWLGERSLSGEGPAVKGQRQRAVKRKRTIVPAALDMDLDDLLSNIATFVPRTASSGVFGARRV